MFTFQDNKAPLDERVKDLIGRLTLEEKIAWLPSHQSAVERLGITEYNAGQEGAHGIVDRAGGKSTVFPQPIALSSTWDAALLNEAGNVIGEEARGFYDMTGHKSFLSLFFPTIDMERDPRWGRNEEAYGEDPFLAGTLAAALIQGVQGADPFYVKAMATPKHFYANNFERERGWASSEISERLKHEYYLRVFGYVFVEGRALSVMTAYNKINGVPGMVNSELDTVLRGQFGCEGYFVTDGGAFHMVVQDHRYCETHAQTAALALKAGMDMFLDEPSLVIESMREALIEGLITEADIEKALSHIIMVRMRLGQFDGANVSKNPYAAITKSVICCEKHLKIARKAAEESVVLLKNDGILPLSPEKTQKIAVLGQLGSENMPDWYSGTPPYEITPREGIQKAFPNSKIIYEDGCDTCAFYSEGQKKWLFIQNDGSFSYTDDENCRSTFRVSDWGYGGFAFCEEKSGKYLTTTEDGRVLCNADSMWGWFVRELFFCEGGAQKGNLRFLPDGRLGAEQAAGIALRESVYNKPYADGAVEKVNAFLQDLSIVRIKDGLAAAADAAKQADAAIAVLGNHTLVGARECIDRDNLDLPARQRALLEAVSRANSNSVLVLVAGYPFALAREEALVRAALFTAHGAQEVGGAIGGALSGAFSPAGRLSQTWYADTTGFPHLNDYDIIKNRMTYLYTDRAVLHPFGYGLSYTSFEYSDLSLQPQNGGVLAQWVVKNTGQCASDEVAQLYAASLRRDIPRPKKQLCGYARIHLKPGETKNISIFVQSKDISFYDEAAKKLTPDKDGYIFMAGASSEDIRLKKEIKI